VHRWWVLLHIAGAFGFVMAHGVSAYAVLRLRRERDPARVAHLLEMSSGSVGVMWNAIGLLLLGGILAGFTGQFWGQGWIWAAIVLLIATTIAMYAVATPWVKRLRTVAGAMAQGSRAVDQDQFQEILRSRRPITIAVVGFVGLLVILWLMIFKPTLGFGGALCAQPEIPEAVSICASNDQAFDRASLTAPAGTRFDLVFDNEDDGVPHNVAIYANPSADNSLFVGETIMGPSSVTYDVPALDPGEYFFRCDVHPQMDGTLEAA
jgi:plastocyanin/uncharacterized membrane protein